VRGRPAPGSGSASAGAATRRIEPPGLDAIREARGRIAGTALRTPLVRLADEGGAREIHLKLECLQPVGSFKIRGAANAIARLTPERLAAGVWTASAGNMAQGVAWCARRLGVPCAVVVPDGAPRAKLEAIERLGARAIPVPFERWWTVLVEGTYPGLEGRFVHPFADPDVLAGNGTIGLEILEDLPDCDAILAPFGGGGLSCGIASAVRELSPAVRVIACEVDTAAPLTAAFAAGAPARVERRPSFVDGIGSSSVMEDIWPLAKALLAGSRAVSLDAVAAAIRRLAASARVVAEGAGAAPVAAALADDAPEGKVVCVVSGGVINAAALAGVLRGETPEA
jgi:threonine dehydratase